MAQIKKKQMQIIILDDKQSLISMIMSHYFYDLTHLEARAEIQKYLRSFFGANENFNKSFRN